MRGRSNSCSPIPSPSSISFPPEGLGLLITSLQRSTPPPPRPGQPAHVTPAWLPRQGSLMPSPHLLPASRASLGHGPAHSHSKSISSWRPPLSWGKAVPQKHLGVGAQRTPLPGTPRSGACWGLHSSTHLLRSFFQGCPLFECNFMPILPSFSIFHMFVFLLCFLGNFLNLLFHFWSPSVIVTPKSSAVLSESSCLMATCSAFPLPSLRG